MRVTTEVSAVRTQVHAMWASVAPAWAEHADALDALGAPITAAMLEGVRLRSGDRVLELASGTGGTGLAAADVVGPTGEVVITDVVAGMVAGAAARAADRPNVRTAVRDLDEIAEPDSSFDAVLCREGLMFAAQPARALREIRRVLRPGGRAAIAVWGPPAANPRLSLMFDAVGRVLGVPMPPPGVPGPFALQDAEQLRKLLIAAGFGESAVEPLALQMASGSFEEWFRRTATLAGPLARRIAGLPAEALATLRSDLRARVEPYETADGLAFPGLTLIATGSRPIAAPE